MVHYIFILYNIVLAFISLSKKVMIIPSIKKNENITQSLEIVNDLYRGYCYHESILLIFCNNLF